MEDFNREELTEAFEYLDELRASGETNMYGAPAYVQRDLAWGYRAASGATGLWMDTFDGKSSVEDRVNKALAAKAA